MSNPAQNTFWRPWNYKILIQKYIWLKYKKKYIRYLKNIHTDVNIIPRILSFCNLLSWVLISSKNSRFKLLTGGLFIVTVAMPIKTKFEIVINKLGTVTID